MAKETRVLHVLSHSENTSDGMFNMLGTRLLNKVGANTVRDMSYLTSTEIGAEALLARIPTKSVTNYE